MASVLAEAVVGKVCELGVQQVANEVSLLVNFTQDFELLKNTFEQINYFLIEADEQRTAQKESVKKWLQSVRDIAWQAEDILEECSVESMYGNITQSCTLNCNQLILRHKMGRRIKNVKARMSSIVEQGNQLSVFRAQLPTVEEAASSSTSQREQFKRTSLLPPDSHPVGIQSKVESIVSLLDDPAHPIIAVVGMGGMGKTYLLQHVFNSTKERYVKSIWLSVSQFYSVSMLQCDLAFHLGLSEQIKDSRVSEQLVAVLIHDKLQSLITEDKRCLIVLDDVWRATREDNLITRLGLSTGNNRSCKIVVTTRSRDVCVNMNAQIYNMAYLSDEESWRLFCVYAFQNFEENRRPPQLEEVGREIVKECGKLPLAIKTIAASLANTTLRNKWESKLRQLKQVATPDDPIMDILKLSYNSLPARLKACFAYLSFFPEDKKIECEYLISLWIGEGFIPSGEEQWDKAWDCLYQLANLCLLEVWEDRDLDKYCKIHDLLLDLAIDISRENKCAFNVEEAFPSMDRSGGSCRIILGKKDVDDGAISQSRPVRPTLLRTLSLGDNEEITNIPASFFSSMRVLRVLDLSYTNISTLPGCVGKMKLLKVLNLRQTQIKEVPGCVRHLKSLSFLDISWCDKIVSDAPQVWISELKCLQHLHCNFSRMPKGISKLGSLRTLKSEYLDLSIEEDEFLSLEDVGNMTQLEELWLNVNHESELKRMEEGIFARLVKMRRLYIINTMQGETESAVPHFPEAMKSMKDVETLVLERFAVPSWICCLANLRILELWDCHCSNYSELQTMHNLVSLRLHGNARCRELPKAFGKSGGFPQLRFLWIEGFPELEELPELEDGAMACLEDFYLVQCEEGGRGIGAVEKTEGVPLLWDGERRNAGEVKGRWGRLDQNQSHQSAGDYMVLITLSDTFN